MLNRRYLALPALCGALLAQSVAAFAQSAGPPAGANGPDGPEGPPAYTQQPNGAMAPGAHRHRRRGPLQRALGGLALSPEQRAKIHHFMHAYRSSRKSGTPETRAQVIAQIKSVLGPDDRARFETRLRRVLQHRHPRAGRNGVGGNAPSAPPPTVQ